MNETTAAEEVVETTKNAVEEMNQFTAYLQENIPNIIGFGVKVLFAILFFLVGRAVIKWIRKIVRHSMERSNADVGVRQFVDSVLKVVLYFILLFSIATKFGVDAASVAALIASGGVAIGLALQGSLSNFAGGVLILLLKPFKVGDYIVFPNENQEGTVLKIEMYYTTISSVDNRTIMIPNANLTNSTIVNVTAMEKRKLEIKVGISYRSNLQTAKGILQRLVEEEPRFLEDEKQFFVDNLGESSITVGLRAWVLTENYWPVKWEMNEKIKAEFDNAGIEIPFPQLDVHVKSAEES